MERLAIALGKGNLAIFHDRNSKTDHGLGFHQRGDAPVDLIIVDQSRSTVERKDLGIVCRRDIVRRVKADGQPLGRGDRREWARYYRGHGQRSQGHDDQGDGEGDPVHDKLDPLPRGIAPVQIKDCVLLRLLAKELERQTRWGRRSISRFQAQLCGYISIASATSTVP